MAIGTGGPLARMRAGINRKPGMIERGPQPTSGVVADGASSGEGRCLVVGVGRRQIIALVAGIAVRGRPGIHAADMADGAWDARMGAGQGQPREVVIE